MKKIKKLAIYVAIFTIGAGLAGCGRAISVGTYDGEFETERLAVTIQTEYSKREFKAKDFWPVNIIHVEIAYMPPNPPDENLLDKTILYLTLAKPGRQNVLNAIARINNIRFVYSADPIWIGYPC